MLIWKRQETNQANSEIDLKLKHIFSTLCISNVYFREPELGINAFVIRVQWQLCGTLVSVLNCKMHEQFIFANSQLYHLNF